MRNCAAPPSHTVRGMKHSGAGASSLTLLESGVKAGSLFDPRSRTLLPERPGLVWIKLWYAISERSESGTGAAALRTGDGLDFVWKNPMT